MPLLKGKENIGRNITELEQHGSRPRSHDQILAIALHVAGVKPKNAASHMHAMASAKKRKK